MLRSWSALGLGSLLLVSGYAAGRRDALTTSHPTPGAVAGLPAGRIVGVGGIFFKSGNPDSTRAWYSKHLGIADNGGGAMLPWREKDDPQKEHVTVWTVFPNATTYFDPGHALFMINYIVDDMEALLTRLKAEGVKVDPKQMNESYGRFAWIYDFDGNKIELWQPAGKP